VNYSPMHDASDDPICCGCCGYAAPVAEFSSGNAMEPNYFCEICSSTHLSSAALYPRQCSDTKLYKSIGWIANFLHEAILSSRTE
jgi:hypothetical protein